MTCNSVVFLRTTGVFLLLFSTGNSSGLPRGLSRHGEGLSTLYDWFKGAAGVRLLGASHVTPAMKRGSLSWLRSTCSAPDWKVFSWLSSVWQRRRNPKDRWSWCVMTLGTEELTGLLLSCTGLVPQWLDRRSLSLPSTPQLQMEPAERVSDQSTRPAQSSNLPGLRAIRSAGPIGNEMWMFPVETGRGLRLQGRGLTLDSGLGRWAYRSGLTGERGTDFWGLGSYRGCCCIGDRPTGLWCRLNPNSTPESLMGLHLCCCLRETLSAGGALLIRSTISDDLCWFCSRCTYSLDLLRRLSKLMSSSSSSSSSFSTFNAFSSLYPLTMGVSELEWEGGSTTFDLNSGTLGSPGESVTKV